MKDTKIFDELIDKIEAYKKSEKERRAFPRTISVGMWEDLEETIRKLSDKIHELEEATSLQE